MLQKRCLVPPSHAIAGCMHIVLLTSRACLDGNESFPKQRHATTYPLGTALSGTFLVDTSVYQTLCDVNVLSGQAANGSKSVTRRGAVLSDSQAYQPWRRMTFVTRPPDCKPFLLPDVLPAAMPSTPDGRVHVSVLSAATRAGPCRQRACWRSQRILRTRRHS